jgi:hypothetical protein
MAKTWSNRRVTDYSSPVERARNRPSNLSVFTGAMIFIVVFFMGLMTYVTVRMEFNPPREQVQQQFSQPDEEK